MGLQPRVAIAKTTELQQTHDCHHQSVYIKIEQSASPSIYMSQRPISTKRVMSAALYQLFTAYERNQLVTTNRRHSHLADGRQATDRTDSRSRFQLKTTQLIMTDVANKACRWESPQYHVSTLQSITLSASVRAKYLDRTDRPLGGRHRRSRVVLKGKNTNRKSHMWFVWLGHGDAEAFSADYAVSWPTARNVASVPSLPAPKQQPAAKLQDCSSAIRRRRILKITP